jgi:uncharacterized membrane protein YfcA
LPEAWTPVLIITVGLCVFLYGISKTAMPVLGVLTGPVMALALTPTVAAGFSVPLLLFGDLIALAIYRQHVQWRLLVRLIPGLLVGFALTAALFVFADITTVGRVVGGLILVSAILEWIRMRGGLEAPPSTVTAKDRLVASFFGVLAGVTTLAANAGGAAMSLYLVRMRVPMLVFMGTSVWFFFFVNLSKVPFVVGLGLVTTESLLIGALFAPLTALGAFVGVKVFRRMDQTIFVRVALALSVVASVWLLIHG